VAIYKCPQCRKTIIREAKEGEKKVCPFCGVALRLREAPALPVEGDPAPQRAPAAAPHAAPHAGADAIQARPARPSLAQPDSRPADPDKPDAPKRRRRRKRRKRSEDESTGPDANTVIYLASVGLVVFVWLVMIGLEVAGLQIWWALLGYGAVVTLVGVVWLYIGAVIEMGVPATPGGLGGRGLILAFGGLAFLLIRLLIVVFFGLMYAVMNPTLAWKPALLTVTGFLILVSGLVALRM
jgi:hypothetical protein